MSAAPRVWTAAVTTLTTLVALLLAATAVAQADTGLRITGTVTFADTGLPVSNIAVNACPDSDGAVTCQPLVFTDADGRYVIEVPDGTYHVEVGADPDGTGEYTDTYLTGETIFDVSPPATVDFVLYRPSVISGQVVDASGTPVVDAFIIASPGPNVSVNFTDSATDGTFALEWVGDGRAYTLRIFYLDADGVSQEAVVEDVVAPVEGLTITLPAASDEQPAGFTDVPGGHPFATEIGWAVDRGITSGFPNGTFRPGNDVTRQAMAAFLYRYQVA